MTRTTFWGIVPLVLVLVACQTPVDTYSTVSSGTGSGLPLGSGHSVYVALADGYGVLTYPDGATGWSEFNWNSVYGSQYSVARGLYYPPVYDVAVSGTTVYAATEDGLLVGSGTSWSHYLAGTKVNSVTISSGQVYVSTNSGLKTSSTSSPGSLTDLAIVDKSNDNVIRQWVPVGTTGYVATASGLFSSSSTTTTASYATPSGLVAGKYPYSGSINSLFYDSTGSVLYAGTDVGLSYLSGSAWYDVLANNSTGLGGAVHGIFVGTNQVYLATEKGLSYGYGSSWTNVVTSRPLNNIVRGVDSTTLYAANGYTGLRIITLDSIGGPASWNTVLAGYDVAKVYVTVP